MTESERIFPFISGDKIRLPHWPEEKWVRIMGYGQVYFIGEDSQGTEVAWVKDGQMAYGAPWELYAPTPPPHDGYLHLQHDLKTDQYVGALTSYQPSRSVAHGDQVWWGTFIPKERILP